MIREIMFDDLDESMTPDVDLREFALDGTVYEIHLTDEHYAALCAALADYVQAARKVSGTRRAGRPSATTSAPGVPVTPKPKIDREQSTAIRDWAERNGYPVNRRGRIPAGVQAAYHAGDVSALKALIEEKQDKPSKPEPVPQTGSMDTAEAAAMA